MESPSTLENARSDLPSPVADRGSTERLANRIRRLPLATPVEATSFWLAVTLPFLYLPLLASGVTTNGELLSVLVLVVLNVIALVVGHGHLNDATAE